MDDLRANRILHAEVELVGLQRSVHHLGNAAVFVVVVAAFQEHWRDAMFVLSPKEADVGTYRNIAEHSPSQADVCLIQASAATIISGCRDGLRGVVVTADWLLGRREVVADSSIRHYAECEAKLFANVHASMNVVERGVVGSDLYRALLHLAERARHTHIEDKAQGVDSGIGSRVRRVDTIADANADASSAHRFIKAIRLLNRQA